jgi:hypothetical protein
VGLGANYSAIWPDRPTGVREGELNSRRRRVIPASSALVCAPVQISGLARGV